MSIRPQPSLNRVQEDLGATLLELVRDPAAGPGSGVAGEVGGVAIACDEVVTAAVKSSGVPLLGLTRGAS